MWDLIQHLHIRDILGECACRTLDRAAAREPPRPPLPPIARFRLGPVPSTVVDAVVVAEAVAVAGVGIADAATEGGRSVLAEAAVADGGVSPLPLWTRDP